MRILILGLDGAGKTTILYRLVCIDNQLLTLHLTVYGSTSVYPLDLTSGCN